MRWAMLGKVSRYRLLVFLAAAILALLVAVPAAYASYNQDHGVVACGKGRHPGLVVKAKGNPVYVKAYNGDGKPVISDDFRTYSGTSTRYYHAQGKFAGHYMQWHVFVNSGTSEYVSRQGTYGYCF